MLKEKKEKTTSQDPVETDFKNSDLLIDHASLLLFVLCTIQIPSFGSLPNQTTE